MLAPAGKQYDVCLFPERAEEQSPHVPRKTGNVLTAAWPIAINVMVACRPTSGTTSSLRASPDSLVSLISNIGPGKEYGIDSEVSLDFSRFGWWNGVLTANYLRRHTSVIDPFDNVSRRFGFTTNWESSAEYRHELDTIIDGHIGFNFSQTGARFINDVDKRDRLKTQGSLTITIEHRLNDNFRINISSNNVLDQRKPATGSFLHSIKTICVR